jgi:TM2 domain-containing membrane protein YozV
MKSIKLAIALGLAAWVAWMPTIMGLIMIMPNDYATSRVGTSLPAILLTVSVLGFAILYLRKIHQGSFKEGFFLGLIWMVLFGLFDALHYIAIGAAFSPLSYLTMQFPVYLGIPILTTLLFSFTQARSKV